MPARLPDFRASEIHLHPVDIRSHRQAHSGEPRARCAALVLVALLAGVGGAEPLTDAALVGATLPSRLLRFGGIRQANPLGEIGRALDHRLTEIRCALPDARVFGNWSTPGAEVCLSPDGTLRVCLGARVSLRGDLSASSASITVTDRPGLCPRAARP